MPASTYVRATSTGNGSAGNNSSAVVNLPSGTTSGDDLLAVICQYATSDPSSGPTAPSGWTEILRQQDPGAGSAKGFFIVARAKYGTDITGAGPWSWTWSPGSSYYGTVCAAIMTTNGYSTIGSIATATTGTTVSPSLTVSGNEFVLCCNGAGDILGPTFTYTSGWVNENHGGSGRATAGLAAFDTTPATTGSLSCTATSSSSSNPDWFAGALVAYSLPSSSHPQHRRNPARFRATLI